MSTDVIRLSPEVAEILREVAARDDSLLLRVPRGTHAAGLLARAPVATAADSRLSAAERHLVQVHREELALALRQAAWRALFTDLRGDDFVSRRSTPDVVVPVPTAREVAAYASEALRGNEHRDSDAQAVDLLRACVAGRGQELAMPEEYCAAAHRVIPTSRGLLIAGSAACVRGEFGSAELVFRDALRLAATPEQAAVAWCNLCEPLEARGRIGDALAAAHAALALLPEFVGARFNRVWLAIRLERSEEAAAALADLEALVGGRPYALTERTRRTRSAVQRGLALTHPPAVRLLRRLAESASEPVREALHVVD